MTIALIFAGGTGRRMNSAATPKQFLPMHGKPVIVYTLEHFQEHEEIDSIVIVCVEGWIQKMQRMADHYGIDKVQSIVPGGETGHDSIYLGLEHMSSFAKEDDIVLIHDGVRPLIDARTISENIQSVKEHGSAITTGIVKETILVVNENNGIEQVPDRSRSRVAKAPQSFWLNDILAAHQQAQAEGIDSFIDCCTMMSHYGHPLYLVDGPFENIKITTPDDFYTMRALLDARENEQLYRGK